MDSHEAQEALLKEIWYSANSMMSEKWIYGAVKRSDEQPDEPYSETGAAFKRLLELGASPRDIALICRNSALEASFSTLFETQMQFSAFEDLSGIHESFLASDPSGLEARPGSAPPMQD